VILAALVAAAAVTVHEVPFVFETRQPISIRVRIDGREPPLRFLFDTGASIHVIDSEVAHRAWLKGRDGGTITGGGEGRVAVQFVDRVWFDADRIGWRNQRAAIVPLRKHYDGMIGAPILSQYVCRFDFARRILQLIEPGAYTPPPGAVTVPFELDDGLPIVHATVDAGTGPIDARLMLDTGAGDVFIDLNRPFVDKHRLLEALPDASATARPAGIGGTASFVYGTGRSFVLGGIVFEKPHLGFSRATQGSSSRSERDGVIGNDLLTRFVAVFDYPNRRLVLEPKP